MPRRFKLVVQGKDTFIFSLTDKVNLAEKMVVECLPDLSKKLSSDYKSQYSFNKSTTHQYEIKKIEQGIGVYKIYLAGIPKVYEISCLQKKIFLPQSYVTVNHKLIKNHPDVKMAASYIVFDSVKKDLFEYCKKVSECLDKQEGILGKYPKVKYVDEKLAVTIDYKADSKKRKNFLNGVEGINFQTFFDNVKRMLSVLTPSDIQDINSGKITLNSKAFLACFDVLNAAGFYNVNGKPLNFWSGPEAQIRANESITSLSDSNVPAVAIMMQLGILLKNKIPAWSTLLCGGSSAVFASQASGVIEIFNASAFNAKEGLVLVAGNFHWENELPIIRKKAFNNVIQAIKVIFYDRKSETWLPPQDANKNQLKLRIVRRSPYHGDPKLRDNHHSVFDYKTNGDRVRPGINMDEIAALYVLWNRKVLKKKASKSVEGKAISLECKPTLLVKK